MAPALLFQLHAQYDPLSGGPLAAVTRPSVTTETFIVAISAATAATVGGKGSDVGSCRATAVVAEGHGDDARMPPLVAGTQ